MPHKLFTAPSVEPITLEEAKAHLRVEDSSDDILIDSLIKESREYVENHTGRALITQTWKLYLDKYPSVIEVPKPPLQSATIQYVDSDGNTQTESPSVYTVDTDSDPGRIYEAYNQNWSATRSVRKAVTVTFVAGYGAPEAVPEAIKGAIKLLVGHFYENREHSTPLTLNELPLGVKALLSPYKIIRF